MGEGADQAQVMPLEWGGGMQQVCRKYRGGPPSCFGVMVPALSQANELVEGIQAGQVGAEAQRGNGAEMGGSL